MIVVVDLLLIVPPLWGLCLFHMSLYIALCTFYFCNHLDEEKRTGVRCLTRAFCSALWHFAMQRYVTI